MIDFEKPIRFALSKFPARVIGHRLNGCFLVERADADSDAYEVNENGVGRTGIRIIENVPDRITRWILVTPHTGYDSKEDAIKDAVRSGGGYTVVKVEFEEGERP